MTKNIIFLLISLTIFSYSCSHINNSSIPDFGKYGIDISNNKKVILAVINQNDCLICLEAPTKFYNIRNHSNVVKTCYTIIPKMRDSKFNEFIKDLGINKEKEKVIQSDELVNYFAKKTNIKEFSSFICIYDPKHDIITESSIFKLLSTDEDFKHYIQ